MLVIVVIFYITQSINVMKLNIVLRDLSTNLLAGNKPAIEYASGRVAVVRFGSRACSEVNCNKPDA